MKVGSLFSGIGGLDLGLERAGMQVVWQVERDDFCRKILAKHWPDVRRHVNVEDCGAHNLEFVDLICGGFPCQPVSVAGARKGAEDERWLWPQFQRILREIRPRWALVENVPGLLSADAGRLFGGILRDLAALGYDAEWDCIPAGALGAHHQRDRVFIVVHADLGGAGRRKQQQEFSQAAGHVAHAHERRRRTQGRGLCEVYQEGFRGPGSGNGGQAAQPRLPLRPCFGENAQQELQAAQRSHTAGPSGIWAAEPPLARMVDGVPPAVDEEQGQIRRQIKALGNAVVPQVAEFVGRRIMEAERP